MPMRGGGSRPAARARAALHISRATSQHFFEGRDLEHAVVTRARARSSGRRSRARSVFSSASVVFESAGDRLAVDHARGAARGEFGCAPRRWCR
jgi:hypothetical protein